VGGEQRNVYFIQMVTDLVGTTANAIFDVGVVAAGATLDVMPRSAATVHECYGRVVKRPGAVVEVHVLAPGAELVDDTDFTYRVPQQLAPLAPLAPAAAPAPAAEARAFKHYSLVGGRLFVGGTRPEFRGPFVAIEGARGADWCIVACCIEEGDNTREDMLAPERRNGRRFWNHRGCAVFLLGEDASYYGCCARLDVVRADGRYGLEGGDEVVYVGGRAARDGVPASLATLETYTLARAAPGTGPLIEIEEEESSTDLFSGSDCSEEFVFGGVGDVD
jgi:hypothetical protein